MLIQYMEAFLFTTPKYRSIYDPFKNIVPEWRSKLKNRMRFKGYLKKNGYFIRVSSNEAGLIRLNYSKDNLNTKQVKVYAS